MAHAQGWRHLIGNNAGPSQVQWLDNASAGPAAAGSQVRRFDAELKTKLQQFQRAQGLNPDGIAGSNTLLRLNVMAGEPMPKLEDPAQRASKPARLDPAEDDDAINTLSEEAS